MTRIYEDRATIAARTKDQRVRELEWAPARTVPRKVPSRLRLPLPVVAGGYAAIVADPPWDYCAGKATRIAPPYPTMALDEILAMPVRDLAAERSLLLLWVTSSFLGEGLRVAERWGFTLKSTLVWVKGRIAQSNPDASAELRLQIGMGSYVRCAHEHVIVATRGRWTPTTDRRPPSVILAGRGAHSAKPYEIYRLAELMTEDLEGRRLELFARRQRPGWVTWGLDIARACADGGAP